MSSKSAIQSIFSPPPFKVDIHFSSLCSATLFILHATTQVFSKGLLRRGEPLLKHRLKLKEARAGTDNAETSTAKMVLALILNERIFLQHLHSLYLCVWVCVRKGNWILYCIVCGNCRENDLHSIVMPHDISTRNCGVDVIPEYLCFLK